MLERLELRDLPRDLLRLDERSLSLALVPLRLDALAPGLIITPFLLLEFFTNDSYLSCRLSVVRGSVALVPLPLGTLGYLCFIMNESI